MRRSLPLEYSVLLKFINKLECVNIIIGTGITAKDLRQKLLLMNLQAPFLVGDYYDDEHNIKHYSEIAKLGGDKRQYRFIFCLERNEWEMSVNAQIEINRFLGIITRNHPQIMEVFNVRGDYDDAAKNITDAMNCNSVISDDAPFVVCGDENDKNAFAIHVTGACIVGGLYSFAPPHVAEVLYNLLTNAGFSCVVYAWGQPTSPFGDDIVRLIRDICNYKCDLLVAAFNASSISPLKQITKNTMATNAGTLTYRHQFLRQVQAYAKPKSNGINHDIDLIELRKTQYRVMVALSRLYGFNFLNIVTPSPELLPEKHAKAFKGVSPAVVARKKKVKDDLLAALGGKYTLDYSETFDDVEDIYNIYAEGYHFSGEGNRLFAQRMANDIIKAFGQKA